MNVRCAGGDVVNFGDDLGSVVDDADVGFVVGGEVNVGADVSVGVDDADVGTNIRVGIVVGLTRGDVGRGSGRWFRGDGVNW